MSMTPRMKQVAALLAEHPEGLTTKQAADALGISNAAVYHYLRFHPRTHHGSAGYRYHALPVAGSEYAVEHRAQRRFRDPGQHDDYYEELTAQLFFICFRDPMAKLIEGTELLRGGIDLLEGMPQAERDWIAHQLRNCDRVRSF